MNVAVSPQHFRQLVALKDKIARYELAEERETYEESLSAFVRAAWPSIVSSDYQSCWAIDALCDHLEAVTLGYIPRFLGNLPPRCSKTTIASVCWPAWTWARRQHSFWSGPQVRFLCGSYNAQLSLINANLERRLLLSPWFQKYWGHRFALTEDQNTKSQFDTTAGGSRLSTSVGGSLLGLGGDVICVDDPHNTETEKRVETDADRIKVASWWRELSSTRLNDPRRSAIVVVMQRLHEEDLSGLILNDTDDEWVHLMVPMRHDEQRHCVTIKLPQYESVEPWEDPREREGELMWPERFGEDEVGRIEHRLGPFMAAGRLQQAPIPKGGGIIMREWWRLWDQEEARKYGLEWHGGIKEFPPFDLVIGSLDTAFKEKEENDYNALTIWGIWRDLNGNRRAMLAYAWNKRLKLNGILLDAKLGEAKVQFEQRQKEAWGLVEWVADTCKRYKVERLLIEDKARGHDVAQEMTRLYQRENWGIHMVNPVGDKTSRLHTVVPLFTDGAVWSPDTRWSDMVITQVSQVPKAAHDDLADTVSMALYWMRENGLIQRGDEMSAALEDEMAYVPKPQSVAAQYGV